MYIYIHIYKHTILSLTLSLSIYIYIYILHFYHTSNYIHFLLQLFSPSSHKILLSLTNLSITAFKHQETLSKDILQVNLICLAHPLSWFFL